jgi:hypothetical protein
MKQALVFVLWVCCSAPGLLLGQSQSKLTVDFVETNRQCRDDAAVVRNCNVAYGHYTITEAPEYHTKPFTRRFVLLCETAGQERGRKDCIPLEGGQSYSWNYESMRDDGKWYQLYEDFTVMVSLKTPDGSAYYAMKTLLPVRALH